ncbi:hypothetical protein GCM10023194_67090 [Planotetraspora phitsanulokensis]|uniref:Uncharacterized protein n=1 Tax=Planotetraspora phitsanulokensis TaxID=575192 RepID=A0A8J3U6V6_9ACTN|nr:hypothetical protein [Planotetraspora phitsanulokensis]GII39729.1 hypothetical protein Pph01_47320 [Planotetraspora phitsanulokensis]
MTLATEVKKITESKPFYALTGAGDFAVEKIRELPEQLQRFQSRQGDLRETAKDLPVKAREYATTVQDRAEAAAKDFPEKAKAYADTAAARFTELYEEFALRGRKIVSKVSGEAAHELAEVSESASTTRATANGAPKRTTTGTARKSGAKRSHS